ncbi:MAG: nitrile hydratase accessory protein [Deltaproteobacteria bacterium]|nr:nitrile hydratase accessory protein [Deltaproteobacteria bacterium]
MSEPLIEPEAARRAAESVPGIPRDATGPVFHAPWEAHAFAMALTLHEKGLFAWPEWSAMLGEEIKKAQAAGDPDTGETYYFHWLATLERMVAEKGATSSQALKEHFDAWERAMHRTPHGKPIELKTEDFGK